MTKYIEIDRAIETALLLLEEGEDEQTLAYNAALVAFVKNMEIAPAADVAPRWIPVTERLPDINDHYTSDVCLVYCDNGAYAFAELEENIFGQVGWDCEREDDCHEAVGTVVAWMPLPSPFLGE